ncbi:MAG: NlpC/P60 family protein [Patescibacteria group bacterium]
MSLIYSFYTNKINQFYKLSNSLTKYLCIPFEAGGRDYQGIDCFGLVKLIYKEFLDINIPDTEKLPGNIVGIQNELKNFSNLFIKVKDPEPFDIILCRESPSSKNINHIALFLTSGKGIHAVEGQGVVVEKFIRNPYYLEMIEGYYRYNDQSN